MSVDPVNEFAGHNAIGSGLVVNRAGDTRWTLPVVTWPGVDAVPTDAGFL